MQVSGKEAPAECIVWKAETTAAPLRLGMRDAATLATLAMDRRERRERKRE